MRTQFVDSKGKSDIVNRFGLETEDAGKIKVNINICTQDLMTKRKQKLKMDLIKNSEKLETRKLVMKFKLDIQKQKELYLKQGVLEDEEDDEVNSTGNQSENENINDTVEDGESDMNERDFNQSNMVGDQNRFI